ncbi:hypothetical protein V502_04565 [Pseudogymnoascus sp. VKM F-4520 (FW-2644)]|nr:hypothetical protein V502_04565 [Pseudogymnoascus sp. VKM F-4520 (FW-2644)]
MDIVTEKALPYPITRRVEQTIASVGGASAGELPKTVQPSTSRAYQVQSIALEPKVKKKNTKKGQEHSPSLEAESSPINSRGLCTGPGFITDFKAGNSKASQPPATPKISNNAKAPQDLIQNANFECRWFCRFGSFSKSPNHVNFAM